MEKEPPVKTWPSGGQAVPRIRGAGVSRPVLALPGRPGTPCGGGAAALRLRAALAAPAPLPVRRTRRGPAALGTPAPALSPRGRPRARGEPGPHILRAGVGWAGGRSLRGAPPRRGVPGALARGLRPGGAPGAGVGPGGAGTKGRGGSPWPPPRPPRLLLRTPAAAGTGAPRPAAPPARPRPAPLGRPLPAGCARSRRRGAGEPRVCAGRVPVALTRGPRHGRGRGGARAPRGAGRGAPRKSWVAPLGGSPRWPARPRGAGGGGPARGPRRWPGRGRRKLGTGRTVRPNRRPPQTMAGTERTGRRRARLPGRGRGLAAPPTRRAPGPAPRAPPDPSSGVPGFCPSQSRRCPGPRFLDVLEIPCLQVAGIDF
ncbi:collagen alpha-1(I) chain-like [Moschus berezovskii]|uniref:collagen alpha-1(I) chain-like n=1 Tax=Moschus berezovskii TaxID=68408 RepID=UPI002444B347|nr:collagen alpha-1(I) chain-like [Moschus berezovskii]